MQVISCEAAITLSLSGKYRSVGLVLSAGALLLSMARHNGTPFWQGGELSATGAFAR